ncbi:MAG TPA: hypothetical protein VF363_00435 [Candidatus Eisenbacteria bacterium]
MNRLQVRRSIPPLLLVVAMLFLACGKDMGRHATEPVPETVVVNTIVFQRPDSSAVAMGTTPIACCGLYDPGFVNEKAMRIVLYDPANQGPGWQILILVDRAQAGVTTTLPTSVVPPSKAPYVTMFATTTAGEWSSDTEESSGTIIVHSFRCTSTTIQIDFSVDAVLGSELAGGPQMRVQGAFQATFPARSCT